MKLTETTFVPKQVLRNKLLAALEDDKVAVILNAKELRVLLAIVRESTHEPREEVMDLYLDLLALHVGAFGSTDELA